MYKSAEINLKVDPALKQEAEAILERLGIPLSTAVDMFLNQVVLVGGIPFAVTIPEAPESIDATRMTDEQFHTKILNGYGAYKAGCTQNAAGAFENFNKKNCLY